MKQNKETLRKALSFKLSTPSKMPGFTFALQAGAGCPTGNKLRSIPGSVCHDCYACKGRYVMGAAKELRQANLAIVSDNSKLASWANELASFIIATGQKEFRFHDSGDLQSLEHLAAIVGIARKVPSTRFWVPTKEYAIVDKFQKLFGAFPSNLVVRLSSPMVGQAPLAKYGLNCTVDSGVGFQCPVSGGTDTCDKHNCRACWDSSVANINYHKH